MTKDGFGLRAFSGSASPSSQVMLLKSSSSDVREKRLDTSFTPNNDGINDVFRVEGEDIRGYWMKIFNRWGELVFYSNDLEQPWQGNVEEGAYYAPDGVYLYQIRIERESGPVLLEGHVHLLR